MPDNLERHRHVGDLEPGPPQDGPDRNHDILDQDATVRFPLPYHHTTVRTGKGRHMTPGYNPEQHGKGIIQPQQVKRADSSFFTPYRMGLFTDSRHFQTYGNCQLCQRSGPIGKGCIDCWNPHRSIYVYYIVVNMDPDSTISESYRILDGQRFALLLGRKHEPALVEEQYYWHSAPREHIYWTWLEHMLIERGWKFYYEYHDTPPGHITLNHRRQVRALVESILRPEARHIFSQDLIKSLLDTEDQAAVEVRDKPTVYDFGFGRPAEPPVVWSNIFRTWYQTYLHSTPESEDGTSDTEDESEPEPEPDSKPPADKRPRLEPNPDDPEDPNQAQAEA